MKLQPKDLAGIDRAVAVEYVGRGADNKEIWQIIVAKIGRAHV